MIIYPCPSRKIIYIYIYILYLTSQCDRRQDFFTDNNVAVSFHRQSVKAYIIDKGAPEMESVMGCFSAKMNAGKRFLDVISYATTTSNFKFRVSYHSGYVHLVISDK